MTVHAFNFAMPFVLSRSVDIPGDNQGFMAVTLGVQRLSGEPTGTITCTFQGVIAGSEIRVFGPTEVERAGVETCDANHVLSWSAYAPGDANNNVRVKVINMAYKIKDFPYTVSAGAQSLPIQQEADPWYSNP